LIVLKSYKKNFNIAALIFSAAIIFLSCGKDNTPVVPPIDRSEWPSIRAENIQTIVSDSGLVKFKVNAPEYEVYDKVKEPYWDFKKGLKLQRFTPDKKVDSEIECNYARFLESEQLWRLENKVVAKNVNDETFETELLFWDQKTEKIYTDKMVRITRPEEQIICYGFESNQNFTIYSFKKVQATFPFNLD
jgi:LPS export ABC transporter protein LptC